MKKFLVFWASIVFLLSIAFVSAIRINEVELNPAGDDTGNEWIEIYSQEEINLTYYSIKNYDNQTINLTGNFSGFFIVNFSSQWLDNSDEKIMLIFNGSVINETPLLSDSSNDNRTWQYCNGNWIFTNLTKGSDNLCASQNQTQNQTNSSQNSTAAIYLELEWDEEEIINGERFDIKVKAFNLQSEKYDIKIYISDNETIISETYNENDGKWQSSTYYLTAIISGGGNNSEEFRLRINEEFGNFSGDAEIGAKIRESSTGNLKASITKTIKILEKKANAGAETLIETNKEEEKIETENISIINLTPKNTKNIKSYKSKTKYIKEYAIYGFALFCIILIIVILWQKKLTR